MRKGNAYAEPLLPPQSRASKASRGSRADSRTNSQGKRCGSGHVGHELDPALLKFNDRQRMYLKTLLEEHSMDYIISRLRKEDPTRSSKLSFVVKRDLYNIVTRYNMAPGWRHHDDLTSMLIRFEENNPDDGLRCLQLPEDPSGKGLLLVIITPIMLEWLKKYATKSVSLDDTFHTTRYNLRLATLMVSDNRDRGLPGAFLISGTMTTVDVQRLFLEIKALIPNFSPATMVTDEAPCFYNGFRAVFPEARTQLHLCRFHIRQTWERKTKELVEASLRAMVNNALQHLLEEVQLDKFQRRFAEILAYLRTTKQSAMAEYLEKNYLGRTRDWASFANKGATLDTTMISERFHLRIKEEFLHRNANSRLDGFVDLLIKAVEDLSESMEVKDRRRFADCAYRLTETHKRHRTATKIYAPNPDMIVNVGENKWQVQNRASSKSFEVTFSGPCTCHPKENTHCLTCGVCAYAWNCTCLDNRSGISCPHRHAVKLLTTGIPAETLIVDEPVPSPSQLESGAPTSPQQRREERYHKLSAIKSTYAVVEATATSLAKVDTDEAMQQLEEILAHLQLAAGVAQPPSSLAVRLELAQSGAKPQLSKIPLYQRGKMKMPKKPTKDLHKEVRTLLESPPDRREEE
ncbi:MULE domain-containing protein [Trichostrongylus colubriformis]|uniref:MULE domain-containing protein n=1 Tax=Trichostrongylus colubriformis TaxID=6319 RepID=A0AAN8IHD4_TRICO